jgi:hypothetical protein
MKHNKPPSKATNEEYERFERAVRQILAVPKSELQKREAEYQKARKATKKKKTV